jgi:hypothetical protein
MVRISKEMVFIPTENKGGGVIIVRALLAREIRKPNWQESRCGSSVG